MQIFPVVGPNGKHKHATSKLAPREGGREVDSRKKREGKPSLLKWRHAHTQRHTHTHTHICHTYTKQGVLMRTNMFMCSPDVPWACQHAHRQSTYVHSPTVGVYKLCRLYMLHTNSQEVTKYIYSTTVLTYNSEVLVLYLWKEPWSHTWVKAKISC